MKPVCDLNLLIKDLIDHEAACFATYRTGGRDYYSSPQARLRWEQASARLTETVAFARTLVEQEDPWTLTQIVNGAAAPASVADAPTRGASAIPTLSQPCGSVSADDDLWTPSNGSAS